jgi:hypothetical protein
MLLTATMPSRRAFNDSISDGFLQRSSQQGHQLGLVDALVLKLVPESLNWIDPFRLPLCLKTTASRLPLCVLEKLRTDGCVVVLLAGVKIAPKVFIVVSVELIQTAPVLVILIRSVGELAPSAVVENNRRPGMSLAPGVPSTQALICAAMEFLSVPSAAAKWI